ncbi:hypothetical protein BKA82DRAFT_997773 [Pisolithus tinctorius]|uniref:Uncharacterized protein n=1 Tax=Pisolithus tinctorius Marx 270 TaxID=870435 RepID=A0A0C3P3H6_PISTI|nr:hypothetical protein BKA82DRAFT_997773 [Pisolithus tinctorius]KIO07585.1 hypothetical protein M404DRAFT_997773 [Pisolithus tinctorius Marx 270]
MPEDHDEDDSTTPGLPRLVCLILFGTPSLEGLLRIILANDNRWETQRQLMVDRTTNINTISALILPTTAAFLTTSGPTDITNWSHTLPYVCLLTGSAFTTLSLVSGLGVLAFLNTLQARTVREMLQNKRKFFGRITLLMMPFLCLFMSGLVLVIGSVSAVWFGNSTWAKTVVTTAFALFIFMIFMIFDSLSVN